MNKPVHRNSDEILKEIMKKEQHYTPEWHPLAGRRDLGVALGMVFTRMQSGTESKYEQLPEKFCTDYFNCLDANIKPASPAEGFVVFGMEGASTEGEVLKEGTLLRTTASFEGGEPVPAELTESLRVVPHKIMAMVETDGENDYVGILKNPEEEAEEGSSTSFTFLGKTAPNIQSHEFFLTHPCLFPKGKSGILEISFITEKGVSVDAEMLDILADPEKTEIFYEKEEGVGIFRKVTADSHCIRITVDMDLSDWMETEKNSVTGRWLGFKIKDVRGLENFAFTKVYLRSECSMVRPEVIYTDTSVENEASCFPFGQRYGIFDEVYFGSGDFLSKCGAEMELSFSQEFASFPIVESEEETNRDWKLIMDKNDMKEPKKYDITIEEVLWEYYNGYGWAKLHKDNEFAGVFKPVRGTGRRMVKVTFTCPFDIAPVEVGAKETYYIRARIRKINNAYKVEGQYLSPVISDVCLSYFYEEQKEFPSLLISRNNVVEGSYAFKKSSKTPVKPVTVPEEKESCLYLGLDGKPADGPVNVLFAMGHMMNELQPELAYEYAAGDEGWNQLNAVDGTEAMRNTGILSFQGIPDARRRSLFGFDLYWLRLRRIYPDRQSRTLPVVENIYMNGASARTIRTRIMESFTIENYAIERKLHLMYGNVQELKLWVEGAAGVSRKEWKTLTEEKRVRYFETEDGPLPFLCWLPTDNPAEISRAGRVYWLDAGTGEISFGKGSVGLLPRPGLPDSIRAEYSFGGGDVCNFPAGSVNGLDETSGFITEVTNPLPFSGGFDQEIKAEALLRAKREQKHRFHAVTLDDYEALAFEASRNIQSVRCFSDMDVTGKKAPGNITMAVLMKDFTNSRSFERQKKSILDYFADKLPIGMKSGKNFMIREPRLMEIVLYADLEIRDYRDSIAIQKELKEKLSVFFDPVRGGFSNTGWRIGELPDMAQINTVIEMVPGVDFIKNCKAYARVINEPGNQMADLEDYEGDPFVLPAGSIQKFSLTESSTRR